MGSPAGQEGGLLLKRALALSVAAPAVAALALRATVADTWPVTAWVVYFVPPPLIAALLLTSALLFALAASPRTALVCALAGLAAGATWYATHEFQRDCPTTRAPLRVLVWNVARGRTASWQQIADYAVDSDADVIGLLEAGPASDAQYRFWSERFPGHRLVLPGGGVVLLVRGAVESSRFRQLLGISSALTADLVVAGEAVRVVLVDLDASPRYDKRLLSEAALSISRSPDGRPVIVMGDFNMPLDSRWFRAFRTRFTHAFEAAGDGMLASWPARWPVVAVDHVWSSAGLAPVCARLLDTGLSDHRAFHADYTPGGPDLADAEAP